MATATKAHSMNWKISSPMTNKVLAQDLKGKQKYEPIGIDVPENGGTSTHYGGVIVFGNAERAHAIVRAINSHEALVEALRNIEGVGHVSVRPATDAALDRANDKLAQVMEWARAALELAEKGER